MGSRMHVYLADFGLTKTSGPEFVTASGQVMGTVAYIQGPSPSTCQGLPVWHPIVTAPAAGAPTGRR